MALLCVALAAMLVPAAKRARAHWRVCGATSFVRASIDRLNAGQLPELSDKCTNGVVRGIEALKGRGLPTDYTVESTQFTGTMCTLDLRTRQGEPFWCMVEVAAPGGGFRLLELAPPESLAHGAAPAGRE